jgi:tetratricopeptide (TPR) repeat protein
MKPRLACVAIASIAFTLMGFAQSPPDKSGDPIPSQTSTLLAEALQLYWTGKLDLALQSYQAILQRDPKSGDAYAGLARVYLKQEKVQEAYEAASSGIAAGSGSTAAQVALGEVYFRQGKISQAEKEFVRLANSGGPNARICLGLARIYQAASLYKRAKAMIDRAHELDPSDPDILKFWVSTLKRSEQIRLLEGFLSVETSDGPEIREVLARHLELLREQEGHPHHRCRIANNGTATETELTPMLTDPTHIRAFGLNVKINGYGSRLLLDTGASGLLIKKSAADKAGIKPIGESKIYGIGDKSPQGSYFGYAKSIRIGGLEFQDCLVEVSAERSVLGDDGLVGADIFSNFLVSIDFPDRKLKLSELPKRPQDPSRPVTLQTESSGDPFPQDQQEETSSHGKSVGQSGPQDRYISPEMNSYTPIFRFDHALLIPTRIGDAPSKLFLIDTGATSNFITPEAAREVTKVHADRDTQIKGLSGKVNEVYRADKAVLQFSRFRQENQDLISFDLSRLSKSIGTEVSGALGFSTLRLFEIIIDYRDGLVDFHYDANRDR